MWWLRSICFAYDGRAGQIDGFNQADDPKSEEQRVIALHPIQRIGMSDNVGNFVAFLASDAADTSLIIDGGISARYAD